MSVILAMLSLPSMRRSSSFCWSEPPASFVSPRQDDGGRVSRRTRSFAFAMAVRHLIDVALSGVAGDRGENRCRRHHVARSLIPPHRGENRCRRPTHCFHGLCITICRQWCIGGPKSATSNMSYKPNHAIVTFAWHEKKIVWYFFQFFRSRFHSLLYFLCPWFGYNDDDVCL
jgi:hypothetical protein